jgi:hypothetical protein
LLLLPGPSSTEMSTVVTRARLAPRRTCRDIDLWTCMVPLSLDLLLTGVGSSFAGHGGRCR